MTMTIECKKLSNGKFAVPIRDRYSIKTTWQLTKEEAIEWVENYSPEHKRYRIDGAVYRRQTSDKAGVGVG